MRNDAGREVRSERTVAVQLRILKCNSKAVSFEKGGLYMSVISPKLKTVQRSLYSEGHGDLDFGML